MTIVPQVAHQFNNDGRTYTVKAETQTTHAWVNGEPVFTETSVVVLESTNADGYDRQLQVVMPLAEAIAFAKAVLAAQAQADEDAWIDRMYQDELDRQFVVHCAVEHGSGYSSGVYYPSLQ
jgi:hypothetical protein